METKQGLSRRQFIRLSSAVGFTALIAACAGALVTFMVDGFRFFKIAKNTKELTGINKQLQKEINSLKNEKQNRVSKDKKTEKQVEPDLPVNPEEQKPS